MEKQVFQERAAGVLLHISSLPGAYGIGSLGKKAYEFVDSLVRCGVRYWQVLPLVQTGYGDSPYQSVYSGSGNPYFIDPEILAKEKLLTKEEISAYAVRGARVDCGRCVLLPVPVLSFFAPLWFSDLKRQL